MSPKLACDFLGKRLAGLLGLDAAKYQYAIDQYHLKNKVKDQCLKNTAYLLFLRSLNIHHWVEMKSLLLILYFTSCIKARNVQATAASVSDGQTQIMNLTDEPHKHQYGTFRRSSCDMEFKKSCNEKETHMNEGCYNHAYQANEDDVN